MRHLFIGCIGLLLVGSCHNRAESPKVDKDSPEALLSFIPDRYILTDTARGDLNLDGLMDLVIVLSADTVSDPELPEDRPVLLLLGQADDTYKEVLRHNKLIICQACGGILGDPYQNVRIADGNLTIEHFGGSNWRWARTTTFRYVASQKNWYLIEDAFVSYHGNDPENLETKILRPKDFGEVRIQDFDLYK